MQAAELFAEAMTVREVASALRISKSEAGRFRQRVLAENLMSDRRQSDEPPATVQ